MTALLVLNIYGIPLGSLAGFGLRRRTRLVLVGAHSILLGLVVTFILPWKWPEFSLPAVALDIAVLLALEITLAHHQQQGGRCTD